MSQLQNARWHNVQSYPTFPNYKASQLEEVPNTNIPTTKAPNTKHTKYKASQATKCPNQKIFPNTKHFRLYISSYKTSQLDRSLIQSFKATKHRTLQTSRLRAQRTHLKGLRHHIELAKTVLLDRPWFRHQAPSC